MEKSRGHVMFWNGLEFYKDAAGELHRAPVDNVIDCRTGYRIGRWEAPDHLADMRINMLKSQVEEVPQCR